MRKYSYFKGRFFSRALHVNKLPLELKEKRLDFWANRAEHLFNQGDFDLAHEYIAMVALNKFLDTEKGDPFRITVWRYFVTNFRQSYSYFWYGRFYETKD